MVKWNLGFSVSSSADAVVPPLYIIVRSDRNHKDRPTGKRPHGAENPLSATYCTSCCRRDSELLEDG